MTLYRGRNGINTRRGELARSLSNAVLKFNLKFRVFLFVDITLHYTLTTNSYKNIMKAFVTNFSSRLCRLFLCFS